MVSRAFEELSNWKKLADIAAHLKLPLLILVLCESAIIVRHIRASGVEVLRASYIQSARGLGISRPAFSSVTCYRRRRIPQSLSSDFHWPAWSADRSLVEVICGWPGLGPLILDATLSRDLFVVMGGVMFSALFMVGGNLVADVLLMYV